MSSTGGKKKPEPSWEFQTRPLSKDEVLSAGEELGRVLGSTRFNLVVSTLRAGYLEEILLTEDHEAKRREMLRIKALCLTDLLMEMATLYRQAQEIPQKQMMEEEANQQAIDEGYGFYEVH